MTASGPTLPMEGSGLVGQLSGWLRTSVNARTGVLRDSLRMCPMTFSIKPELMELQKSSLA
jgi:hypothetical protein